MKTYLLLILAATASIATASASENPDTVAVINNPSIVKVISNGNTKTIVVEGRKGQPDYYYEYTSCVNDSTVETIEESWIFNPPFTPKKNKKQSKNPYGEVGCDIYAGAVIPTAADRGFDRTGWEIGMLNVARINWNLSNHGTRLSIGIGWQYSHFTIGDGMMLGRTDNGKLTVNPIPDGYHSVKSTLKSFALQIPFTLSQKIYKAFTIEAGGVAMLNTYTSGSCTWGEGDVSSKMPVKDLHQRLLTVDAMARIGWRGSMAFYVRYSPMSQFKPHHGPQYNSVAIGLTLGF